MLNLFLNSPLERPRHVSFPGRTGVVDFGLPCVPLLLLQCLSVLQSVQPGLTSPRTRHRSPPQAQTPQEAERCRGRSSSGLLRFQRAPLIGQTLCQLRYNPGCSHWRGRGRRKPGDGHSSEEKPPRFRSHPPLGWMRARALMHWTCVA